MFCPKCGKEVDDNLKYCPTCGAELNPPAEAVPVEAEPVSAPVEPAAEEMPEAVPVDPISVPVDPVAEEMPEAVPVEPVGVPVEPIAQEIPQGVPIGVPVGVPVNNVDAAYAQPAPAYAQPVPAASKKPVNKKLIKLILIIAGAVIAAVVAIIVIITLSSRVNAEKFVNDEIVYEGVSGYGSVSYNAFYDYEGLQEALGEPKAVSKSDYLSDLYDEFGGWGIQYYIDVDVDKNDELKNGDKINVTIKINYDSINKLKFKKKLVGDEVITKEYEVKGLTEPVNLDPFEAITSVSYDETYYGSITINYNTDFSKDLGNGVKASLVSEEYSSYIQLSKDDENIGTIYFSGDNDDYSKTKKIKIKTYNKADDYAYQGIILSAVEKEYEPDLIAYLEKADTLSKDDYNAFKKMADEDFKDNYDDGKFKAAYFGSNSTDGNGLYFVYSYKDYFDETSYGYVYFSDVKVDSSGKVVNIDDIYHYSSGYYDSVKSIESNLNDYYKSLSKVTLKE